MNFDVMSKLMLMLYVHVTIVDSVLQQLALYGLDIVVPKLAQICTNCVIVTLCGQKILLMF